MTAKAATVRTVYACLTYDPGSPFFVPLPGSALARPMSREGRPEQLLRGIHCPARTQDAHASMHERGPKIPLHHQLADLPLSGHCCAIPCRLTECSLSASAMLTCSGMEPRRVNAVAMFSIAARFHVPIWVGCTPYFWTAPPVSSPRGLLQTQPWP